jgi:hypothetical protein
MMFEGLLSYQRVPGVSTRLGDQDKVTPGTLWYDRRPSNIIGPGKQLIKPSQNWPVTRKYSTASITYLRVTGQFWEGLISCFPGPMMFEGLLSYPRKTTD